MVGAPEAIVTVWELLAIVLSATAFLLMGIAIPLQALQVTLVPIAWGVAAVLVGRAVVSTACSEGLRRSPCGSAGSRDFRPHGPAS